MDFVLGMMETEMVRAYAKDVASAEKEALAREMTLLRENLRTGQVAVPALEPVLKSLREAMADETLTAGEVAELAAEMEKVNDKAQASHERPSR